MAKIIFTKAIPNLPSPNQTVQRKLNLYGLNVDGFDECATIPYEIEFTRNGKNVSNEFEKRGKPMQWRNSDFVYQRDLETFQPISNPEYENALLANQLSPTIPNPNYIDLEKTPLEPETIPNPSYVTDEQLAAIDHFKTAPAFDYFVGLFTAYPELFWDFLGRYIDENYGDGWFGTQGRR